MSGAEGWSRRTLLAGAAALVASPGFAIAEPAKGKAQLGIRYARAVRFQAPEPVPFGQPDFVSPAALGPSCPQQGARYQPQSEDCQFLNVWTPDPQPAKPKPVMVYIHGGAYSTGSVADPLNDGAKLAQRGDVVVVILFLDSAINFLISAWWPI